MNTLQIQRTKKIKQLLSELDGCLKMSVGKAIEIGKELHDQKENFPHGQFLSWVENELPISRQTVDRYIKLYLYKNKMSTLDNLQEAYKQIEQLEQQERRKQELEDNRIINERINTGIKPDGWERRHDRLFKARTDEAAYQERKKVAVEGNDLFKKTDNEKIDSVLDDLRDSQKRFEDQIKQEEHKAESRKKLRITDNSEIIDQEIWFESFKDYIYSYDNINRRLEVIQNFIKYLKGLGAECQRELAS